MSEERASRVESSIVTGEGESVQQFDGVIVGAGFAGMYMLHRLRQQGLSARVFEAGDGVGGTWYWNRYPGARCDIPSMEYSYQFSEELQQEWEWSERYATQPEILKYANHVADRFDLWPDMQFNTRVVGARFDEEQDLWRITLDEGGQVTARHVVMATGCLSVPNFPNIPGMDQFSGPVYHTGMWPHEGVDFTGKKVGVIGTGSSAIQSIPIVASQAESVTVFQRTPNYSIPAHNAPLDREYVADIKSRYRAYRDENWQRGFGADFNDSELSAFDVDDQTRTAEYESRWKVGGLQFLAAFNDLVFDDNANATARDFIKEKIRSAVGDPQLAEKLVPSTPVGCKRLCVDSNYYETYRQDHVELIDLNEQPISRLDQGSVVTTSAVYDVDCLILATGFDAMTGAVTKIDIEGVGGRKLTDKWSAGPRAYLGLATEGFPNLFLVTGPGSPSVLSNMLPSIEHHVEWISDCIEYLNTHQNTRIHVHNEAEDAWVSHVNEVADTSVYPRCNSWYLGANVEGKERVFMPYLGVPPYREKCAEVVQRGYEGFEIS
ncbi:MAG: NAD(P)/FAD-dependent oxidoreductase [Pseudomonadota bacterium]